MTAGVRCAAAPEAQPLGFACWPSQKHHSPLSFNMRKGGRGAELVLGPRPQMSESNIR